MLGGHMNWDRDIETLDKAVKILDKSRTQAHLTKARHIRPIPQIAAYFAKPQHTKQKQQLILTTADNCYYQ